MQFNQVENPRGNPLKINGQVWIFAPLSLGAAEQLMPKLKNFDPNDFALVADVAHKSLKRNYPDITREFFVLFYRFNKIFCCYWIFCVYQDGKSHKNG